ncbi:MAG: pyridoxal-dependent decarboxylase [Gemmatimonadaceae bacterium]
MTFPPLPPLGDMSAEELRAHLHRMADWVADYRAGIEGTPIVPTVAPGWVAAQNPVALPGAGAPMDAILDDLDRQVMPGVLHWGHPSFLGYFGSTSNGPALLGEIAAAALNVSAMTWKTSPSATELEGVVLRWIRDMIGLDEPFMGIVYDTASVGVLHALAAARERVAPGIRARGIVGRDDVPLLRVYASDQAHSSIAKALVVLGLGEENLVRIGVVDAFEMDVGALRAQILADRQRGFTPMAIVATVGTTSTASVDPVAEIADVAEEYGAWLHVDAAYGGAMGVLPEGRAALRGVERADSVVVNPHKWLFVPLDFSVLFVRDPEALRRVFALTPEYLEGDAIEGATNYMDYGIQLGRRFRALKAWMVFRAFGRDGIEARVREHCRLAEMLTEWIAREEDFHLAAPQRMGVVCFRYRTPDMDDASVDRANEAIVERVNASGAAYLTHTRLQGRVCMRVGLGNVLTEPRHVRGVWDLVVREAHAGIP